MEPSQYLSRPTSMAVREGEKSAISLRALFEGREIWYVGRDLPRAVPQLRPLVELKNALDCHLYRTKADQYFMETDDIDWTLFQSIEQIVADLIARGSYPNVHGQLAKIARESEDILAVLDQLGGLVESLSSSRVEELPEVWKRDIDAQIYELRVAYADLVDLVATVMPQKALQLLSDKLH